MRPTQLCLRCTKLGARNSSPKPPGSQLAVVGKLATSIITLPSRQLGLVPLFHPQRACVGVSPQANPKGCMSEKIEWLSLAAHLVIRERSKNSLTPPLSKVNYLQNRITRKDDPSVRRSFAPTLKSRTEKANNLLNELCVSNYYGYLTTKKGME